MPRAKIQLQGHFALDRAGAIPLSLQIAHQLQGAIEVGRVLAGSRLPSTRSLSRMLGVSRNTVVAAYDELTARGFVRSRHGVGTHVAARAPGLDIERILRDAHYPSRTVVVQDPDGNVISVAY